jgi:hypothetical protein
MEVRMANAKKCYKMDRECNEDCIAFRYQYPGESHRREDGDPFILFTVDGNVVGDTNCFDLYLRAIEIDVLFKKRK